MIFHIFLHSPWWVAVISTLRKMALVVPFVVSISDSSWLSMTLGMWYLLGTWILPQGCVMYCSVLSCVTRPMWGEPSYQYNEWNICNIQSGNTNNFYISQENVIFFDIEISSLYSKFFQNSLRVCFIHMLLSISSLTTIDPCILILFLIALCYISLCLLILRVIECFSGLSE